MSVFLYFFPGKQTVRREDVAGTFAMAALRDAISSNRRFGELCVQNKLMHSGPGGQTGTLLVCLPGGLAIEGFLPDYREAEQEWRQIGDAWLGWYRDNPPIPENLQRKSITPGTEIELGDERTWVAPIIRRVDGVNQLPHAWGCNPAGKMVRRLMAEHQANWQMAGEVWDCFTGERGCTVGEAWDYCIRSLGINYRLGPHEIDALQLLSDENYHDVFKAVVDWHTVEAVMDETRKKKASEPPEVSASSDGSEAA
jgi:hypothetical protein